MDRSVLIWRRKRTVGEFFRKWHRVIAFLGATIVLATFVVEDEKRDAIKDEIEQIRNVRSTYLIRENQSDLLVRMSVIESMIRGFPVLPKTKTPQEKLELAIKLWEYQMNWVWDKFVPKMNSADNLVRLADSLPGV